MKNLENINFKQVETREELAHCLDIREKVFVKEQNVSISRERDGLDEQAEHFLLFYDEIPVATARMIKKDAKTVKLERVAVLQEYRGKNLGKIIMEKFLEYCKNSGIKKIIMDAQTRVIPFYEKLGFERLGEEFLDANIPHYKMEMEL